MTMFEYLIVPWPRNDNGTMTAALLNDLGTKGWEAVGLAPRSSDTVMPGMGGVEVSEMIVLMKRKIAPARKKS
jgi:hypothetical protein